MDILGSLDRLHARARQSRWLARLALVTRILLVLGFTPSGLTKLLGNRFTSLPLEDPVGFFFEAMYQTGFYWRFLGLAQVTAAALLLIPRTTTLGAVIYFPIILNIFLITVSVGFQGTPFITGPMLLGATFLLAWDWHRLRGIFAAPPEPSAEP